MTYAELGAELDIIYENINKNGAPGLDNYEKSVILTHAEELLVKETLKVDPTATQFPQLIETFNSTSPATSTGFSWGTVFRGVNYDKSVKVLKILNETVTSVVAAVSTVYTVIPISQEVFDKNQINPYKYPPTRRAWRISGLVSGLNSVEIFGRPNTPLTSYKVRYVRAPKPIIVGDLTTASPFSLSCISTYAVAAGGTGYSVGDILSVAGGTGGTATFKVLTLSGTGVATILLLNKGFGITASVTKGTSVAPTVGINCTLNITVVDSNTIDGLSAPQTCELDPGLHRDVLKVAASLAEQYYLDKYETADGTTRDKR